MLDVLTGAAPPPAVCDWPLDCVVLFVLPAEDVVVAVFDWFTSPLKHRLQMIVTPSPM